MEENDLLVEGVVWREGDKQDSYIEPVPEIDRSINKELTEYTHNGRHYQEIDENGEVIWTEPPADSSYDFYDLDTASSEDGPRLRYKNRKSIQGPTRGFDWRDEALGIDRAIKAYPDRPIPHLHCPDCGCQAVETDQVGVALCSGTPGWYFYYRQRTNGIGQPEPKLELVGGEMKEVLKDRDIVIERVPTGEFREVKPTGELGKEVPRERVKRKDK